MRDIKFRAWDKKKGEMWEPEIIKISDNKPGILCDSGEVCIYNEPIMQWIGLQDKNKIDIYKGDIVRVTNQKYQIQTMDIIGVIAKNFASWGVIVKKNKAWEKYSCSPPDKDSYLYFLNLINSKVIEIIGNVYQNLELIKDKGEVK